MPGPTIWLFLRHAAERQVQLEVFGAGSRQGTRWRASSSDRSGSRRDYLIATRQTGRRVGGVALA